MTDMLTHGKLFTVEVDGHGAMIARSPLSEIEITRVEVVGFDTDAHVTAAKQLMTKVFEDLRAQGYPHAHDDDDFSRPTEDMEVEV